MKDWTAIGLDILRASRNELYLHMPYLDAALCGLRFQDGSSVTATIATDGEVLYYDGSFLAERYLRSGTITDRAYLHVILHCMLRHLSKKRHRVSELWDIACDAAVESILDELPYPCLTAVPTPAKQRFYGECRQSMPVLTAEGIYRKLLRDKRSEYELAQLQRLFLVDDHGLWDMDRNDQKERSAQQDKRWNDISEKTKTGMETLLAGQATGGEAILKQVRVETRDDVDYRKFLRRFATPREVMEVDGDAFDFIYYTYGLQHYGNMPLVEPPETKEEKRIEDLVIAIDTSMSTSGELVMEFLRCTYAILRSTDTFTRKLNIHIIQCDDTVRSDTTVRSMKELEDYMEDFSLQGGSATDFRPVFDHVARLQKEGRFTSLRGLIYFTDGMGIYPQKRPPYDVAFVLLEEPPVSMKMPPWCIRLLLNIATLEKAALPEDWEDEPEELPEL